jgi:hypothetical protein
MINDLRGMIMIIHLICPPHGGTWPNANHERSSGDAERACALLKDNHSQSESLQKF